MAKRIISLTNFNAPTTQNPDGSLKDRVYDTDGETVLEEGSKILAPYVQDALNVFHRAGRYLGKFLNDVADTQLTSQFYDWLAAIIAHGGSRFGSASFSGNTYAVTLGLGSPLVYREGLTVTFRVPTTYVSTIVNVNLNGLGDKRVSDNELGSAEAATVATDIFEVGKFVTLVYTVRSSDAYGYWRVKQVPLDRISDGQMRITTLVGDIRETLYFWRGYQSFYKRENYAGTINIKYLWETILQYGKVYAKYTDNVTSEDTTLKMDATEGVIEAEKELTGGTYQGRLKHSGVNFGGGPNSGDTAAVDVRFTRVSVAQGTLTFATDTAHPADWVSSAAVDFGVGDAEVFGAYAHYTTFDGKVRSAPLQLLDTDPAKNRTGEFDFVIMAGDGALTGRRPYNNSGNDFMTLSIWYDGSVLA